MKWQSIPVESIALETAESMEATARDIYANSDGLKALVWEQLHKQAVELMNEIKRAVKAEGGGK